MSAPVTWPVGRVRNRSYIWNSRPGFAYSLSLNYRNGPCSARRVTVIEIYYTLDRSRFPWWWCWYSSRSVWRCAWVLFAACRVLCTRTWSATWAGWPIAVRRCSYADSYRASSPCTTTSLLQTSPPPSPTAVVPSSNTVICKIRWKTTLKVGVAIGLIVWWLRVQHPAATLPGSDSGQAFTRMCPAPLNLRPYDAI